MEQFIKEKVTQLNPAANSDGLSIEGITIELAEPTFDYLTITVREKRASSTYIVVSDTIATIIDQVLLVGQQLGFDQSRVKSLNQTDFTTYVTALVYQNFPSFDRKFLDQASFNKFYADPQHVASAQYGILNGKTALDMTKRFLLGYTAAHPRDNVPPPTPIDPATIRGKEGEICNLAEALAGINSYNNPAQVKIAIALLIEYGIDKYQYNQY